MVFIIAAAFNIGTALLAIALLKPWRSRHVMGQSHRMIARTESTATAPTEDWRGTMLGSEQKSAALALLAVLTGAIVQITQSRGPFTTWQTMVGLIMLLVSI